MNSILRNVLRLKTCQYISTVNCLMRETHSTNSQIVIPEVYSPFRYWMNSKLHNEQSKLAYMSLVNDNGVNHSDLIGQYISACSPNCKPEIFSAISDFGNILNIVDATVDDDKSFQELELLINIWSHARPKTVSPWTPIMKNVVARFQIATTPSMIARGQNILESWKDGATALDLLVRKEVLPSLEQYNILRRADSFLISGLYFILVGLDLEMTTESLLQDELLLCLLVYVIETSYLINDLYSIRKELLTSGSTFVPSNIIPLIAVQEEISIQYAIFRVKDLLIANMLKLVSSYNDLAAATEMEPISDKTLLINESKFLTSGALYFSKCTPKYMGHLGPAANSFIWPGKEQGVKWDEVEFMDESEKFYSAYGKMDWKSVLKGTPWDPDLPFVLKGQADVESFLGLYKPGTLIEYAEQIVRDAKK